MDLGPIDRAVAYRIRRIARLLRVELAKALEPHGLSQEQYFILYRLHECDGRSQRELADPTLDDRANITRIVAGLQKRGLVRRERDDEDRRVQRVFLTDQGRTAFSELRPLIASERTRLFADLADDLPALDRVLDHLERVLAEP